jgi:hypothetical protein
MAEGESLPARFGVTAILSAVTSILSVILGTGSVVPLANPKWFETYIFPLLTKLLGPKPWLNSNTALYMAIAATFLIIWIILFVIAIKLKLIIVTIIAIALIAFAFYIGILQLNIGKLPLLVCWVSYSVTEVGSSLR